MIVESEYPSQVYAAVFNSNDKSHALALKDWTLQHGDSETWDAPSNATGRYTVLFKKGSISGAEITSAELTNNQKVVLNSDGSTTVT